MNVWANAENAVVATEIPGIDPDSLEISVVGSTLTIKGSRQPEETQEGESYHRRERWYGRFARSLELPFKIESEKVKAHYAKGILTVSLPRAEAEKPKKIEIMSE
jgi:HSP20 family protein